MTHLAEFLLARIAEDEALWGQLQGIVTRPQYAGLARHTLADCSAKRDVVREHQGYGGICGTCGVRKPETGELWPCRTLRLLSFPYIDHPDYREEWKP